MRRNRQTIPACCPEFHNSTYCCYYPTPAACCCTTCCPYSTCQQPPDVLPVTYKKLSQMAYKLKTTDETSANKSPAKLKKKNQTKNGKETSATEMNTMKSDGTFQERSSTDYNIPRYIGTRVRLYNSESDVVKKFGKNEEANSTKLCEYECYCKPLAKCSGKQNLEFKLVTQNDVPVKQIHQGRNKEYSESKYTIISDNLSQKRNFNSVRYDEKQEYHHKTVGKPKQSSYDSSTISSNSFDQPENSQETINYHVVENFTVQPLKCYCPCCTKAPETKRNGLQQDVFDDENEQGEHFSANKLMQTSNSQAKAQASLEDSWTHFSNTVFDKILESLHDSVDNKLKELISLTADNFASLGEMLNNNQAEMNASCSEMMEKITEQNAKNFEKFQSLVQDLMAHQELFNRINTENKECQCESIMEKKSSILGETLQSDNSTINEPTSSVKHRLHNARNTENDIKILRCGCCHCCSKNNTQEKLYGHSNNLRNLSNETLNSHLDLGRSPGGCTNCNDNKRLLEEESNIWGLPRKFLPRKLPNEEFISRRDFVLSPELSSEQSLPTLKTFTTYCLIPSHRTIYNCNCCTDKIDGANGKTKEVANKNSRKNLNLTRNSNYRNNNDSANEQEDTNEVTKRHKVCNRLSKVASKHYCSHHAERAVSPEVINADSGSNDASETICKADKRS